MCVQGVGRRRDVHWYCAVTTAWFLHGKEAAGVHSTQSQFFPAVEAETVMLNWLTLMKGL